MLPFTNYWGLRLDISIQSKNFFTGLQSATVTEKSLLASRENSAKSGPRRVTSGHSNTSTGYQRSKRASTAGSQRSQSLLSAEVTCRKQVSDFHINEHTD